MMDVSEMPEVKRIVIEYADGDKKVITRGVVFSVCEKGDMLYVSLDGIGGSEEDCVAVLSVVSGIAKEMGVPDDLALKL